MKPMPDQGGLFIVFYSWLNGKLEILSDLRHPAVEDRWRGEDLRNRCNSGSNRASYIQ